MTRHLKLLSQLYFRAFRNSMSLMELRLDAFVEGTCFRCPSTFPGKGALFVLHLLSTPRR